MVRGETVAVFLGDVDVGDGLAAGLGDIVAGFRHGVGLAGAVDPGEVGVPAASEVVVGDHRDVVAPVVLGRELVSVVDFGKGLFGPAQGIADPSGQAAVGFSEEQFPAVGPARALQEQVRERRAVIHTYLRLEFGQVGEALVVELQVDAPVVGRREDQPSGLVYSLPRLQGFVHG